MICLYVTITLVADQDIADVSSFNYMGITLHVKHYLVIFSQKSIVMKCVWNKTENTYDDKSLPVTGKSIQD
jgi:hypothetical protein